MSNIPAEQIARLDAIGKTRALTDYETRRLAYYIEHQAKREADDARLLGNSNKGKPYTQADRDLAKALRFAGHTWQAIGVELNRTAKAIQSWARDGYAIGQHGGARRGAGFSSRDVAYDVEPLASPDESYARMDSRTGSDKLAKALAKVAVSAPASPARKSWSAMTHDERLAAVAAGSVTLVERAYPTRAPTYVAQVASC